MSASAATRRMRQKRNALRAARVGRAVKTQEMQRRTIRTTHSHYSGVRAREVARMRLKQIVPLIDEENNETQGRNRA